MKTLMQMLQHYAKRHGMKRWPVLHIPALPEIYESHRAEARTMKEQGLVMLEEQSENGTPTKLRVTATTNGRRVILSDLQKSGETRHGQPI